MGAPLAAMGRIFYTLSPQRLFYASSHHEQGFAPFLTAAHLKQEDKLKLFHHSPFGDDFVRLWLSPVIGL